MTADLAPALEAAIGLAQEAGAMLRAEFHRPGGPRGRVDHAEVDERIETFIRSRLRQWFPDWGYLGEETGSAGLEAHPDQVWLVDPNDGTRDFLAGARGSSISIGLLRQGQPVLGVVYSPLAPDDAGDLLSWAEGCGPPQRNRRPLAPGARSSQLGELDCVVLSSDVDRAPAATLRCVAPARYRPVPSIAYRLALVAAGEFAAGGTAKGAGAWDYGAAHGLLRALGLDLFDHNGREVRYAASGESRARRCFGSTRELAAQLLARPWDVVYQGPPAPTAAPAALALAALQRGQAVADPGLLRRAHGCLLGQLIGDSLGSLVEGLQAEDIQRRYPDGLDMANGGVHRTLAGQPTDDSELALALARSILAGGGYDPERAAQAYGYWWRSQPFDFGATTRRALSALSSDLAGGAAERAEAAADPQSQANGSLMRVSPLGIWGWAQNPDAVAAAARADSRLTHPHPICQEACALFAVTIAHAVASGEPAAAVHQFARSWARAHAQREEVAQVLAAAEREPPRDDPAKRGWVLVALHHAFHQLLRAESAEAGIRATVAHGGDTDTNAAITGALLGAVHGRESWPHRWRNLVLSCRPLAGAAGVQRPRPRPFWPVDALELAERLLLVGAS